MIDNKTKTIFFSILMLLNFAYANEKQVYSNLLSPKTGSIIDIGKKDSDPTPNISKILKEIPASVRVFDNNFILAERNLTRHSCYADQHGNEACSVGLQVCNNNINYISGTATEHHIHQERDKERVTATKNDREDDTFYANWLINPNHGSVDGSRISVIKDNTYNAHDNFPSAQELYREGWKTADGKFAMKIFNYGSGCGGMSVYPLPDHVQVIASGGSSVHLQGYVNACNQLISSGNGQYATVLVTWDNIPTEPIKFECDDFCLAGKPTSPVGYWKWGCNAPWSFRNDKCYLDYYYYTYSCPNNPITDEPLPTLVTTGSDCGGYCGGYGCKCNSDTPPYDNCAESNYTCPYGSDIPCAAVTTPNNVTSKTNNELGYSYALGNSIKHENNLTKTPSCPNNGTFDETKSICVASSDTGICPTGSTLLDGECVVPYNCPGVMVGSNCEVKPDIECTDSNARYFEAYRGCAIDKGCSRGTLNPISGKCEFNPEPPSGWQYDTTINQFVKQPLITTDPICADPALSWNGDGRCNGSPDFTNWTIGDDKNGVTGVTGSLTVNSDSIVENRNTAYSAWFVSPVSISQGEFSGRIQIGSGTTSDSVGLLFGFQGANDYYVFDWSNPSSHWGGVDNGDNAAIVNITNPNYENGTEINSSYEVTGNSNSWSENTTYDISVRFRDDKAEVFVNGNEILNASGLDANKLKTGKIGFWEYSIQNVTYSNFTIQTKPTCPSGYIYMDGYDICVYNEGDDVTIDIPNNRYLRAVYCTLGDLNQNTGKCETSAGCGGSYPNEDDNQNKCYGTNNYNAVCPDTTHWTLVNSNDISGYDYVCRSINACTGGYHSTTIDGNLYCAQEPQHSCPVGYVLDKESGNCYADPVCTDGYVYDKNLKKCVIHYKWYEYTCPSGYEGPIVSKGKDCEGYCGYDGCSCNMKTPPANNCRERNIDNTTYDLFEKRNMIVHQILSDGNFNEKEFGVVKRFACNENQDQTCSFDVTKIWGDGDQLCFSDDAGTQSCYKVSGCQFWGKIDNSNVNSNYRIYNKSNEITNLRVFDKGYGLETLVPVSSPDGLDGVQTQIQLNGEIESGEYTTPDTYSDPRWIHVPFNKEFGSIPVVFSVITTSGSNPATIRIKNVTKTGFDAVITEPYTQDGPHIAQTIQYLAITPGTYYLGGHVIKVGTISTKKTVGLNDNSSDWESISLDGFSNPIVLTKIQTVNNILNSNVPSKPLDPWLTSVSRIDGNNLYLSLDFDDSNNNHVMDLSNPETIGYLIIDGNIQGHFDDFYSNNRINFETIKANNYFVGWSGSNSCKKKNFVNTYSTTPIVIGSKDSRHNSIGGWFRKCASDSSSVGFVIDTVYPSNRSSVSSEDGGIFVFSGSGHTYIGEANTNYDNDSLVTYNSALGIYLYHNRGIHSTCKMNGGVGWITRGEGISSIMAGGVVYNYAVIDANGSIDWDVNATAAGQDSISEGFNIGLMAIKLSDGNWYVAKDFKDKNGNTIDRKLPDFVKKLDNSFYKISNVVKLPDGNTTVVTLDCSYNGHQLDPSLCGLKTKIIMPQGKMKIVKIRDIQSLLNFKEPIYGQPDSNQTYWYKNNEYNLTLKFPLADNTVIEYRGDQERMSAIDIPENATAESKINIFGNSDITGNDTGYLNTIDSIESETNRKTPMSVMKDRLYFWDSFIDGFIGSIQFVREVQESDRLEGFVPEDVIPYYMLENGFVSFSDPSKRERKTIFVNNMMSSSSSDCSSIANNIGGVVLDYTAGESMKGNLPSFTDPADTSYNLYGAAGVGDIAKTCIIEKDGLHAMEDVLAAQRKLIYTGSKQMMCSPYKCVDFECKLAECPDGYTGNNVPNSFKDPGKCILNTCDFFDPNGFVKVCGKLGPCNTEKPGIVKEGNTCKELYCPEGSLDPVKGTCTVLECPDGYHEDSSGKCVH